MSRLVGNADALDDAGMLGLYRLARSSRQACRLARSCSRRLRNRGIMNSGSLGPWRQHVRYSRLPPALRSLPALAVLREPLSWQLSYYSHLTDRRKKFRRARLLQGLEQGLRSPDAAVREAHRSFVAEYMGGKVDLEIWLRISLEGYWRYIQNFRKRKDFPLGFLGSQALQYAHPDPERIFAMPPERAEEYFASERLRRDLRRVRFLRHERLWEDVYPVMAEQLGYRRQTLDDALKLTPGRMNRSDTGQRARALRELEQKPWLGEEMLRDERVYTERFLPLAGAPSWG